MKGKKGAVLTTFDLKGKLGGILAIFEVKRRLGKPGTLIAYFTLKQKLES